MFFYTDPEREIIKNMFLEFEIIDWVEGGLHLEECASILGICRCLESPACGGVAVRASEGCGGEGVRGRST